MARRRRGGRGTGGHAAPHAQPARDLAAEAQAAIGAVRQARMVAEALFAVTVLYVDDDELRSHASSGGDTLPSLALLALLAVGCTAPHIGQHGPQVRIAAGVLDRLSAEDVTAADIAQGERLATALLGVAASVAARDETGRAGRFVASVDRRGAVALEELTGQANGASICAACLSEATQAAWQARIERGKQRRAVEAALRDGRRVLVDYSRGGSSR